MVGRTGYCLLFILISLVETATSQEDLFTSKNYGCKTLYNFTSDVINAVFTHTIDGTIYENATSNHFPVAITIPANSSIPLTIEITTSTGTFTKYVLQNSSEYSCKESVIFNDSRLCFIVVFTCPDRCEVLLWPKPMNLYKISECNDCTCSYCFIGSGEQAISFIIPMTSFSYNITIPIPPVTKISHEVVVSRQDLQKYPLVIPFHYVTAYLPAPWGSHIQDFFIIDYVYSKVTIQLKKDSTPPENGHFQIFFYYTEILEKDRYKIELREWNLIWYSPPRCKVFFLPWIFLNNPLLSVNCDSTLQNPIIFYSSNNNFQMKDNLIFLKELTTHGSFNIDITAMYKDRNDSATTVNVSLTLKGPHMKNSLITECNCEALFDFDLLNYTSVNLKSQQLGLDITLSNIKDYFTQLPSNKTTIFNLQVNGDMEYTITAVSPEYCCNASITDVVKDLCFNVTLTCPDTCLVSIWPDFIDFYKFSECKGCKCSYCYNGKGKKNISVSVPMKSSHYQLRFRPPNISKYSYFEILSYKELSSPYNFSYFGWILPVPWGSQFLDFFAMDSTHSTVSIQLKKDRILPQNGHFMIYFYVATIDHDFVLYEQQANWYSPPRCNVSYLHWISLNNPLLSIDCENPFQWKMIFYSSNSNFQMKENLMFLKDLTTFGTFNFYISAKYKDLKDSVTKVKVYLTLKGQKLCPANINNGIKWPETPENTAVKVTCRDGYSGTISRFCSNNGNWELPDTSNCLKKAISDAKSKLDNISSVSDKGFESALKNLAKATKQSIGAKDITETLDALKVISTITNKSKEVSKKEIKNVVNVVDNLIKGDAKTSWKKLEDKNQSSASSILKLMEDFGNIASQKINETVSISRDNLLIQYEKVNAEDNIHFPAKNSSQPKWVKESVSRIFVPSTSLKNKFGANESVSMNAVIFRNMKDMLPQSKNTSSDLNSYVLSISFGKKLENLTENVVLSFTHLSSEYDEPSCNFWDFNINPEFGGYWSTRGCKVTFSNSTNTECSCDHLTNFAILMNVVQHKDRKVLGIITKVGCSISIVALILTIIIYAVTWKSVTSQAVTKSQSILLMNLCVSLIISYLIFLTLVQGPREKNVCTAIAALLHYFFLVVFFTMLAEGVDMTITVTVVFTPKFNRLPWLLVSSWVAPAIIVGASLGITKTHGFGNDVFCWLTTESNVIWSFIIPALIIIVINIACVVFIVKSLLSTHCMLNTNIKQRLRTGARAIGILTPLLGFTWIFGIFAVNEATVVFEYIFTIASSLQGLFIFIAYCIFNKQTRKGLHVLKDKSLSRSSIKQSKNTTKSTNLSSSEKSKKRVSISELVEKHYPVVQEIDQPNPEDIFKQHTM